MLYTNEVRILGTCYKKTSYQSKNNKEYIILNIKTLNKISKKGYDDEYEKTLHKITVFNQRCINSINKHFYKNCLIEVIGELKVDSYNGTNTISIICSRDGFVKIHEPIKKPQEENEYAYCAPKKEVLIEVPF